MTSINIACELKFDRQVNFEENQMRTKNGYTVTKLLNKTTESAENNWWPDGDGYDMWRATKSRRLVVIRRKKKPKRARPNTPQQSNDKKQKQTGDHVIAKELTNGNTLSGIDNDSGINKKLPTETFNACLLKKSTSMESVFEGTTMRHSFTWRMGDECVSLEKYVKVYTRNPEELYEAVKKRAIEEEEIKASQIGIDKTTIQSNLRILDEIIREEEEKAKLALKQAHTKDVDEAIDGTLDKKIRVEKENGLLVLQPVQTGSFDEDIDGTDKVGYEEKTNTSFDIIFEKPKKRMFKPKLSSQKGNTVNLMTNVKDMTIKSNKNKEDVKLEEKDIDGLKTIHLEGKKHISFDIIKAHFQSKPSIYEKKDKGHENKHKEDTTTADNAISVDDFEGAYREKHALRKNVSFDVFFESPKKLKSKPKLTFINIKQENVIKNNTDDKEYPKVEKNEETKHEKSHEIIRSKTTEVHFSNGKLGGNFKKDVSIKRKDDNEVRFKFSLLHGTTSIPSRIPIMVRLHD
ncbi:unnamed protein product [Mytilus coruscus]|uniref:Uncharacterized protein n=1 Tax=Mytilus coruscus TaxID=42192 RepID=A0A6J8EV45_MYTCO|nr:unnamed protein product [Mytilus coruscus]